MIRRLWASYVDDCQRVYDDPSDPIVFWRPPSHDRREQRMDKYALVQIAGQESLGERLVGPFHDDESIKLLEQKLEGSIDVLRTWDAVTPEQFASGTTVAS
jgi:hypothetical protein